jgi:DNA invertase Pin-like site-specific DNA recombinase
MTSAVIYTRISRDIAGEGLGVQRQEDEARALAERLGLSVSQVFSDNDVSATSGKTRPGFEGLLASGQRTVIVWHQDRLLRVSRDLERVLEAGLVVHSVQAGTLDLATPQGRAVARTVSAWSTYETEAKAERQRAANRQRRAAGERHRGGARTFGFDRDMEHIPAEAEALREAAAAIRAGESVASVVRAWNVAGLTTSHGNTWTRSAVRRALLNPAIAGLATYNREVTGEGDWAAVLPREDWDAVCAVLRAPERVTQSTDGGRKYLLPGLLTCGRCGAVMGTGRTSKGTRTYRCVTGHLSRKADPLDDWITGATIFTLTRPGAEALTEEAGVTVSADTENALREVRAQLAQWEAVAAQIGPAEYLRVTAPLRDQEARLAAEIAEVERRRVFGGLTGWDWTDKASRDASRARFDALPLERRRAVIRELFATITVERGTPGKTFDPTTVRMVGSALLDRIPGWTGEWVTTRDEPYADIEVTLL